MINKYEIRPNLVKLNYCYGAMKCVSNTQLRFEFETKNIQQKELQIPTIDSIFTNYY